MERVTIKVTKTCKLYIVCTIKDTTTSLHGLQSALNALCLETKCIRHNDIIDIIVTLDSISITLNTMTTYIAAIETLYNVYMEYCKANVAYCKAKAIFESAIKSINADITGIREKTEPDSQSTEESENNRCCR